MRRSTRIVKRVQRVAKDIGYADQSYASARIRSRKTIAAKVRKFRKQNPGKTRELVRGK